MFKSLGAYLLKKIVNYLGSLGIKWVKDYFYNKEVDKEVTEVERITDEIYKLEDKRALREKNLELPLNVLEIEDINKKIKVLENELREAGSNLSGDLGTE